VFQNLKAECLDDFLFQRNKFALNISLISKEQVSKVVTFDFDIHTSFGMRLYFSTLVCLSHVEDPSLIISNCFFRKVGFYLMARGC